MFQKEKYYYQYDFFDYSMLFFIVSFMGWIYEMALELFIFQPDTPISQINRGILYGPVCPIYGVGAILIILLLTPVLEKNITIKKIPLNFFIVFFGTFFISMIVELIGSYIMEAVTGSFMWNYSNFAFNFQGRIAPNPAFRFAIGGLIVFYIVMPIYEKITMRSFEFFRNLAVCICYAIFFADCFFTFFSRV